MNISEFRADIANRGVLKSSNFTANITIPTYLIKTYGVKSDFLSIRCESSQIPGMSLATYEGAPRYGYGPPAAVPYVMLYDNLNLNFIVDKNGISHKFFYDWLKKIVNFENDGISKITDGYRVYEVGYKNQFSTTIGITLYDNEEPVVTTTLLQAFPKGINSIDLDWQQSDNLVKLSIPISYREYKTTYHREIK